MYSGEVKDKLLDVMEKGLKKEADTHEKFPDFRAGLLDAFYTLKVMRQAPVIIMVYNPDGGSPFEPVETDARTSEICDTLSVGVAIENMLLKATEIGLGTLWIANTLFAYNDLTVYIGEQGQLVSAVAVGYADEFPDARPRKDIREVILFK